MNAHTRNAWRETFETKAQNMHDDSISYALIDIREAQAVQGGRAFFTPASCDYLAKLEIERDVLITEQTKRKTQ